MLRTTSLKHSSSYWCTCHFPKIKYGITGSPGFRYTVFFLYSYFKKKLLISFVVPDSLNPLLIINTKNLPIRKDYHSTTLQQAKEMLLLKMSYFSFSMEKSKC